MLLWQHIRISRPRGVLRLPLSLPVRCVSTPRLPPSERLLDAQFDPIRDSLFATNSPPPFSLLASTLELISSQTGPNSKAVQKVALANFFRSIIALRPDHLAKAFYLCVGRLTEEYKGVEMRTGKGFLAKTVAMELGMTQSEVRRLENATGDLAEVFYAHKESEGRDLTVAEVYDALWALSQLKGQDSVSQREEQFRSLLSRCSRLEGKYVIRFCQKSLKVGIAEVTVQSALARAVVATPPKQDRLPSANPACCSEQDEERMDTIVKKAANECQDVNRMMEMLLMYGPKGCGMSSLSDLCKATPGVPVKPMTAHPCKSLSDLLKRFPGKFTCEFKYDGIRAQIHRCQSGKVHLFSRNSEDITGMFPDVVETVQAVNIDGLQDWIADCEIVAFDRETGRIQPFQAIQQRKRSDVQSNSVTVTVCAFLFDLLYLSGRSVMSVPFSTRRQLLSTHFRESLGRLQLATHCDVSSLEEVQRLLSEAVKIGCEGLMAKSLDSEYEPAKRSFAWLKLKKDYLDATGRLSDSLDLVPIAASYGSVMTTQGKRKGVFGSFLLAAFDPDSQQFQSVCRLGTGFSDEFLADIHKRMKDAVRESPHRGTHTAATDMDVWFEPKYVWEVKAADLTLSPVHTAAYGRVSPLKGVGLRFPRFLRERTDKSPAEATTTGDLLRMFQLQSDNYH